VLALVAAPGLELWAVLTLAVIAAASFSASAYCFGICKAPLPVGTPIRILLIFSVIWGGVGWLAYAFKPALPIRLEARLTNGRFPDTASIESPDHACMGSILDLQGINDEEKSKRVLIESISISLKFPKPIMDYRVWLAESESPYVIIYDPSNWCRFADNQRILPQNIDIKFDPQINTFSLVASKIKEAILVDFLVSAKACRVCSGQTLRILDDTDTEHAGFYEYRTPQGVIVQSPIHLQLKDGFDTGGAPTIKIPQADFDKAFMQR
jgi:hypothetical protein